MRFAVRQIVFASLATASIGVSVAAHAALSRAGSAHVAFTAVGPAGLKIVGTTSDLDVSESSGDVKVRVPLANLDTGIGLRNRHMREKYLQVQLYPNADLVVSRSALKLPNSGDEAKSDANGTMTLHGKSKPVRFSYNAKRDANRYHVTGSVHLNMNDFGIEVPSYLGVTVKPEVDVSVAFDATE